MKARNGQSSEPDVVIAKDEDKFFFSFFDIFLPLLLDIELEEEQSLPSLAKSTFEACCAVFCCWVGGWGAAFFFRLLPKVPLPLLDTSVLVEETKSLELESLIFSTEPFLVLLVFRMSLLSSSFSSASSGARESLPWVGSIFFLFTVEELSPSSSWACSLWSCFCIGTWYSVFTFEKMFYYSKIF